MDVEEVSEPMNFHVCRWMQQLAAQKKAVIAGSVIIRDGKKILQSPTMGSS